MSFRVHESIRRFIDNCRINLLRLPFWEPDEDYAVWVLYPLLKHAIRSRLSATRLELLRLFYWFVLITNRNGSYKCNSSRRAMA